MYMRMFRLIIFFLLLVFLFSCEEQGLFINCPDCVADEPLKIDLEIKVDIGYHNSEVNINVYEGNIEDSVIFRSFQMVGTKTSIFVPVNKKYTVTASYMFTDKTYIAVDSATPRVRYSHDQCDDPCYFIYDKICDLRLLRTK